MKRHVGMLDETWEGTRVNLWTKVLMILVFTLYLACTLTEPCIAKPVQLVDYDAQTFFENYKLICRNYSPLFNGALVDSNLTYQGETSLYKKYMFRTNNNAFVSIYENKAGGISVIEAKREMCQDNEENYIVLAGVCVEYTLDLNKSEMFYLDEAAKESEITEKGILILRDNSSVYSKINRRYIHRQIDVSNYPYNEAPIYMTSMIYSADDAE